MNDKDKYLKDLFEDLKYSVSKFDSQTLAISGGALGFSLTFIKDIVPFSEAIHIWLLYISLALFIFTISFGLLGHYLSIRQISNSIESVSKEKYDELKPDKWIPKINASLIISIAIGIILMIFYCVINIENQRSNTSIKTSKEQSFQIIKTTESGNLKIEGDLKSFSLIDTSNNKKTDIKVNNHEREKTNQRATE
jgi:F0F1-type ATP synthase membrane subunit a